MMENAGRNLALLAIELLGQKWQSAAFLVMAGGGGNGGGGICAARHLANRDLKVRLCLSEPGHMSEVAQWQRKVFQFAGVQKLLPQSLLDNSRTSSLMR
jgi:NAD(P)H-hydrate epimerase